MPLTFQLAGQKRAPDRKRHVWRHMGKGRYKCVLCGGISSAPSDDVEPLRYEVLTNEERDLCPQRFGA